MKIEIFVQKDFIAFSLKDYEEATKRAAEDNAILLPYNGSRLAFVPGTFDTVNQLLALIKRSAGLPEFSFREVKESGKNENLIGKHEGITFNSKKIQSILGFEGVPAGNGIHIGYKLNTTADELMKSDDTKAYYWELPADLLADKHLILLYAKVFEYQKMVDVSATFRRHWFKTASKNGSVREVEPTQRTVFSNLDYKKLLTNTIQSVSIELLTETSDLISSSGTEKNLLTSQFKKFLS